MKETDPRMNSAVCANVGDCEPIADPGKLRADHAAAAGNVVRR